MTPINEIKLLRLTTCLWSPCGKLRGYTKALGAWQTRIPLNDIAAKKIFVPVGSPDPTGNFTSKVEKKTARYVRGCVCIHMNLAGTHSKSSQLREFFPAKGGGS